jgi:hypothetical protein
MRASHPRIQRKCCACARWATRDATFGPLCGSVHVVYCSILNTQRLRLHHQSDYIPFILAICFIHLVEYYMKRDVKGFESKYWRPTMKTMNTVLALNGCQPHLQEDWLKSEIGYVGSMIRFDWFSSILQIWIPRSLLSQPLTCSSILLDHLLAYQSF